METFTFDAYMAYGDTEKTTFEIDIDPRDHDLAKFLRPAIVKKVGAEPVFCNDLTGELWMFDMKLGDGLWLENIHPSNDLKTVRAGLYNAEHYRPADWGKIPTVPINE